MKKKILIFLLATTTAYLFNTTLIKLENKTSDLKVRLDSLEVQNAELQVNIDFLEEQLDEKVVSRSKNELETSIITPTPTPIPTQATVSTKIQKTNTSTDTNKEFYRVVSLEAIPNNYEGCLAVATVVMNRLESGKFGNSIRSILSAPNQFSTWSNKNYNRITPTVKQAVDDALAGKRNLPSNTLFFYASYAYKPGTGGKIFVAKIGDNTFFRYN